MCVYGYCSIDTYICSLILRHFSPAFLLGFLFFGGKSKEEEEDGNKDPLIWELKKAKHSEMKKVRNFIDIGNESDI